MDHDPRSPSARTSALIEHEKRLDAITAALDDHATQLHALNATVIKLASFAKDVAELLKGLRDAAQGTGVEGEDT